MLPIPEPKQHSVAAQHTIRIRAARKPEPPLVTRTSDLSEGAKAQLAWTGDAGKNPNVSIATPATVEPVASRLQPNTVSSSPGEGVETPPPVQHTTRTVLGPANWGSSFDTPTLRDRSLYEELIAKLPKRSSVIITVDDQGRATNVQINAPGLDAAMLDDLRARLLAARYAPVERDGIAFDGTLRISAER